MSNRGDGAAEHAERLRAMTREERLEDARQRVVWDPENHPDPVIRRLYRESCERTAAQLAEERGA